MRKTNSTSQSSRGLSYQWVIIACSFLLMFVNIGLPSTSFSVFQPYIAALPDVGDGGGSIVLTVRALLSFIALTFVNKVIDILNIKYTCVISCLLTAAGFALYSFSTTLPLFIVGSILTGIGYGMGGMVCITIILERWCDHNLGTAIGIATVGSGAAATVVPFVTVQLIHQFSLGVSFLANALLATGVAILILFFLKNNPPEPINAGLTVEQLESEQKALDITGSSSPDASSKPKSNSKRGTFRCSEPLPRFLAALLYLAVFLMGAAAPGGSAYLSINMTTEGIDPVFAGFLISLFGVFLMIGKVLCGRVMDRFGSRIATALFCGMFLIGLLFCWMMPLKSDIVAALAAVFFGFGVSISTVGLSVWSIELTDDAGREKNIQRFQTLYVAGGMVFSLLPGFLTEVIGSYAFSYGILFFATLICTIIILFAYRYLSK